MTETALQEQIKVLVDLQAIDSEVYQLEQDLQLIPSQKDTLKVEFESKKSALNEAEENLKAMQLKLKELENEVGSKEELVKKYLTQQAQVKTNQEYSALTKEIETANADRSLAEDQVLALMDEVDVQKGKVQEERKKLQEEEAVYKADVAKLDERASSTQKEIESLKERRKKYLSLVEPDLLGQYELILKKRDGVALSKLQGETCGACSVNFPPQVVNLVKLKRDIVYCEACSRIVYEPTE